jgi:hypothetical protein
MDSWLLKPENAPLRSSAWITACFAAVLFGATMLGADGASDFRASPAYQQLLQNQDGIQSSIADIEVRTKLKGFLPISLTLRGHFYFRAPDQESIVFDNVPGLLKGMVKNKPDFQPAAMWPRYYEVRVDGDDGGATAFHLVPIDTKSSLASIDVAVNDATGYMTQLRFVNANGPVVTTAQTYGEVGRHEVIVSQAGETHGPGYKADISTHFTNYQMNVPVPDSVFTQQ